MSSPLKSQRPPYWLSVNVWYSILHGAIVHRSHATSVILLRVQRDSSLRDAELLDSPYVLSAKQLQGEDWSRAQRISNLLHVHAASRRDRTNHF